jgi:uncharacterized protein
MVARGPGCRLQRRVPWGIPGPGTRRGVLAGGGAGGQIRTGDAGAADPAGDAGAGAGRRSGNGERERMRGEATDFRPRYFEAPRWLRGAHAQTIAGRLLRPAHGYRWVRERIETPDGDFVDLDWGPEAGRGAPTVLVLHGLEGSARRRYVRTTFAELLHRGLRPLGLNFRSCSGEPNRTTRLYHSGETGDLRHVLAHLRSRCTGPIGAVGFSLGGNVLLKYLGEESGDSLIRGAVAVSVPFELAAGSAALEATFVGRRLYGPYFLRKLRAKTRRKAGQLVGRCDVAGALRARTLRAFDEAATAPLHGFRDAADYYEQCSSARYIEAIRVPTLLLQAEDDPFLPAAHLPRKAAAGNVWVTPVFVRTGGHVGFIGGSPLRPRFWAEEEAARFLATVLAGG